MAPAFETRAEAQQRREEQRRLYGGTPSQAVAVVYATSAVSQQMEEFSRNPTLSTKAEALRRIDSLKATVNEYLPGAPSEN